MSAPGVRRLAGSELARLLRRAGWAPVLALVVHELAVHTPWRRELDGLLHFLGGAAAAFFLFHAARAARPWLGPLRPAARHLLAFGLTCAVAITWEIAEFASDHWLGTRVQQSLEETMRDLVFGVLGAVVALVATRVVGRPAELVPHGPTS